ncbi:MAG: L-aspartate oxidase [Candidatus Margulisbacteria bacterium]|nr:L-aspartate oxidase [Candidatus Margulisiibacteriota bacterium]
MLGLETDVLVIGTGISGLMTALTLSDKRKVLLVTKSRLRKCNTYYAQGGVAVVLSNTDNVKIHIRDTMRTGLMLADEKAVEILVNEGPERVKDLIDYGICFNKKENGEFEFLKEGAHSERRILHAFDKTGYFIENGLLKEVRHRKINYREMLFLDSLSVEDNNCSGAIFTDLNTGRKVRVLAQQTVLATGGAGAVYQKTTNWNGSFGDGLAAAYLAGADIRDMEFYQFHPTAIQINEKANKFFLISESVRGEGAIIINEKKERFLYEHDERGELAPRDIVARAIANQLEEGHQVYLDFRQIEKNQIQKVFPMIYKNCLKTGVDITRQPIAILPVAHYMIGGIKTDYYGQTSVHNLYACGEVASTGVHGANRLASNSLLECMVYGHRVGKHIAGQPRVKIKNSKKLKEKACKPTSGRLLFTLKADNRALMYNNVGIKRDEQKLKGAEVQLKQVLEKMKTTDCQNVQQKQLLYQLICSYLIVKSALSRKESRGAHFRSDYPKTDNSLDQKHTELNIRSTPIC